MKCFADKKLWPEPQCESRRVSMMYRMLNMIFKKCSRIFVIFCFRQWFCRFKILLIEMNGKACCKCLLSESERRSRCTRQQRSARFDKCKEQLIQEFLFCPFAPLTQLQFFTVAVLANIDCSGGLLKLVLFSKMTSVWALVSSPFSNVGSETL